MARRKKSSPIVAWLVAGGLLALFGPSMVAVGTHSYARDDSHPQPANDNFADARVISGATGSTDGTTAGAGKEDGENHHNAELPSDPGGASVWFQWVAPSAGMVTFDTNGSQFDTVLAAYHFVGESVVLDASDDQGGSGNTSVITFPTIAERRYYIVIDGYFLEGPQFGPYILDWDLVDTTLPETAILSGPPGTTEGDVASFTFAANEPNSTFQCQLDSGPWEACGSPKHYSDLPAGQRTFMVRAIDPLGNADATPAQHVWTIVFIDPRCGNPGVICGTSGNETIVGTNGDDIILGGGGDDVCLGLGGNDFINCGTGNDRIEGGAGNDNLSSTSGNDVIRGGPGRDRISGGSGRDRLSGQAGADRIRGGPGRDRLSGGNGNDGLNGGAGNDRCRGGRGNNVLRSC